MHENKNIYYESIYCKDNLKYIFVSQCIVLKNKISDKEYFERKISKTWEKD